jgi:hypothetical protein
LAAVLAVPAVLVGEGPAAADTGLSVAGNLLLKDGAPYLPHGFNLIAVLTPPWCLRTSTQGARDHFGQAELDAAHAWNADTLRFQVSERGLADPSIDPSARRAYLDTVVAAVTLARTYGFTVIVSMQDQGLGCGAAHPLPSQETVDAWSALAPALMGDPYVMFELFNEPQNNADAAGWAQWRLGGSSPNTNLGVVAVGHQALVDHLRALGSTNVLIADAARYAELTAGMPRLTDPAGRLVYGIHPYAYLPGVSRWDVQYGAAAGDVPLIATEWNYLAADCGTAAEKIAPDLLTYLRRHHIGVLGHAFDVLHTTVADWNWTPTRCGTAAGGSGSVLRSSFTALAQLDLVPPAAPAGLTADPVSATAVTLGWTPPPDADVASYEVVRDGVVVGRPTQASWSDSGLTSATTYSYTVRAVDTAGNVSGNGAALAVTTATAVADSTPPTSPTGLVARVVSPTQVRLNWQPGTDDVGVTGYQVSRDGVPVGTAAVFSYSDTTVRAGAHTYAVTGRDAAGNLSPAASADVVVPSAAANGLTGSYFDTAGFTSKKLVRTDPTIAFSWGTARPAATVGADTFSVQWTGSLLPVADGTYTFYLSSDEGVRLWIDGAPVLDDWTPHLAREVRSGAVPLTASRAHVVRIDYYDKTGAASVRLSWSGPGFGKQVVPATQLLAQ